MGANSRNKGANAERAVTSWLRDNGFPYAERRIAGMDDDKGDVTGIGPLVVEVKDRDRHDFPAYYRQLLDEMEAAGVNDGIVLAKRKRHPSPGEWYALMPAEMAVRLLREAGHGDGNSNS